MNCVILQPSYIPWRGFFHQIQKADVFVFYDDVQFDRHGWRNRNRIKTPQGSRWLTIPVHSKRHLMEHTPIREIEICHDKDWSRAHCSILQQHYGKSPYFHRYWDLLDDFYRRRDVLLADFTIDLTVSIARELGLHNTRFTRSSALDVTGSKTGRLLNILAEVKATHYISGPSARDYIEADKFAAAGITLEFMTYDYPEYPQLYPPFDPRVSILDLLFMTGPDASRFIWGQGEAVGAAASESNRGDHL